MNTLQLQKEHALEANRMYRAAEILKRGDIRKLPSGNYQVYSQSDAGKTYMVNPRYEECNCPDCVNGNVCKHYIAYLMLISGCESDGTDALTNRPTRKTYDDYLKPRVDVIAQREQMARANKPKCTEWVEELDYA